MQKPQNKTLFGRVSACFFSLIALIAICSSSALAQNQPESMEEAIKNASMAPASGLIANDDDDDGEDNPYMAEAETIAKKAASGGIFSSCTANPFAFCSGPRPSKKHKFLRACWNFVCP